ncbi:hypothetical protein [Streptomyces benahoarensis]|uniref:Uncharacterized protein n=1 Tax=Streptomyces benahoarensis TaxID=2595054 RepID=A0A553ZAH8_9ACTN|nr:hypothetical protein [Streptomyces benahoarensis]TSB21161.1 hypothetical protein FNJ62_19760 [Streptomyces benahoarensis]TSB38441.1 hypothetical protein FNZ23_17150 [Streptomyces benahoarensis]
MAHIHRPRREQKSLRRGLTRFEARLPSSVDGIGFHAQITATVHTEPPYPQSADELAAAIRATLRKAAADVSKECDPADLATTRDVCGRHLAGRRLLPTTPPVAFDAKAEIDLLPDDQAAVNALLAALRRQATADAVRRQQTGSLARELADPAAVLTRWLDQQPDRWGSPPETKAIKEIATVFAQYRPERERTVDHAALELIRDFLASFQDPPQKRMVYEVLAAGMHHAHRPDHAARAEALLDEHEPADAPESGV